jgi:hypothetical protein
VALMALAAWAQAQKKNYRTSPTGYNDTPVLPGQKWRVHDIARPVPPVVTPGVNAGDPPSDAVVLFDGKDTSKWVERAGQEKGPVTWKVEKGAMTVRCEKGAGSIETTQKFGSGQYHIEWSAPAEILGDSQWRGNSGILLMNRYEIQVLDSFNNKTYADGQAGAIYGQWPPFVNVARKPGEWQVYDIYFEAPEFNTERKIARPPYVTVVLNGVLLHHHQEIIGPMAHKIVAPFQAHGAEEPFGLQNHDTPVRYRNIWVRKARAYDRP